LCQIAKKLIVHWSQDIVTESDRFNLDAFVPILKDKMYSKDKFARAFNLGWIQVSIL
jgi:vacuole morphology and inheritance protein 14